VILDCQFGAERLATTAAHHGDAVLVCGLGTATSSSAAANWAVRCWDLGEERRTAMVVNRLSGSSIAGELNAGFLYRGEVPVDPLVSACDTSAGALVSGWLLHGARNAFMLVSQSDPSIRISLMLMAS
jgi:hypothetical protein